MKLKIFNKNIQVFKICQPCYFVTCSEITQLCSIYVYPTFHLELAKRTINFFELTLEFAMYTICLFHGLIFW